MRTKDGRIFDGPRFRVRTTPSGPIALWNLGQVVDLDQPAYQCELVGCSSTGANTVRMMGPPPALEPRFVRRCVDHTDRRHDVVEGPGVAA